MRLNVPALVLLLAACQGGQPATETAAPPDRGPLGRDNMAYRWATAALEGTANDTERNSPRPTVTSRLLALTFTAQFDAWSRYDSVADPVHLQVPRRPQAERTLANKEKAISYAMCRALCLAYPADSALFLGRLKEFGYDPQDRSLDPATPQGIGNLAARNVFEARKDDGSNMYGTHPAAPVPYGDYTHYTPVNPVERMNDIDHWQPKYFTRDDGTKWAPGALTPHWGRVRTLMLDSASQFRSPPPPRMGEPKLEEEVRQVVAVQGSLTFAEKALVEFMRDGPRSVQQAGHWLIFSRDVSVRDQHDLDRDVQMYFVVTATAMDAFIACWETKFHYDSSRPFQQVHHLMGDEDIIGWPGPHQGQVKMKGRDWRPYSPASFLCPAFPSYISGHSTVSGGCSKALELFTGSDRYGMEVRLLPGWLTEPGITADSVTLSFPTFSSTAEQAGWSRVLGGYHIQSDNVEGLAMGRKVAAVTYAKCKAHIDGRTDPQG
ncbi:MAG: vanadium-dependent haloperoxidase [Flavobacteriales bacterium]|nr:hypothetical protein [Flavobacteriales bacterium]MCC6576562.1 vanadium-dependent haloperoxidase [Flavobacteriales bacterium]NUQ15666.1 vanadium-dependent haloperoxidase [Flavobacteriales bacterium]